MEKDNKNQREKSKITSFEITEEMLSDSEFDLFLKESLIREADKIEQELNNDENLRGVGASDDLFQSIVDKLKEQGVWEEEKQEKKTEELQRTHSEDKTEKSQKIYLENEQENILQEETESARTEKESPSSGSMAEQDAVYRMLSEEDRLNIEAGKKYRMQEEKRKEKQKKRVKIIKRGSVAAAAFAIVFGLSMTSDADRRLMLKAWDGIMMDLGFRMSTNYVEQGSVRSKTKKEMDAIEDVREQLGSAVIEFEYLPQGMIYEGYDILNHNKGAYIFYSCRSNIFCVSITSISNADQDSSSYFVFNQDAKVVDVIENEQDIQFNIFETDQKLEKPMYAAEVQYKDFRYIIDGINSMEELKKIIKYCIFL